MTLDRKIMEQRLNDLTSRKSNPIGPYGVPQEEWDAAFAPSVQEIAASQFLVTIEDGSVRVACGRRGPPTDDEHARGAPSFPIALTLTPLAMMRLMTILSQLLK